MNGHKRRSHGEGSIFQKHGEDGPWTIQYYKDDPARPGKRIRVREYTGKRKKTEALALLQKRCTQLNEGEIFETRRMKTVRVSDLYATMQVDTANKGGDLVMLKCRWRHLSPLFANMLAANVTTDDICSYTRKRQQEKAANATINRELAALRRMFNLGKQCTPPKIKVTPYIPMLKENNVRTNFVEDAAFSRLAAEARDLWLRALLEVMYTYGWRRGELLGLRVRQVSLTNGTIRLDPGTTKNKEGREVEMTAKVRELLTAAIAGKKPDGHVFTRANGEPVKEFRAAFHALCIRAGLGEYFCPACNVVMKSKCTQCGGRKRVYRGLLVHDFRRSAAKAARRAGVPESVIMAHGGWKTSSMFRRYAIVSSADRRAFVDALEQEREKGSLLAPITVNTEHRAAAGAKQKVN